MSQTHDRAGHRLGPFLAGSTVAELTALVGQGTLGLRLLEPEEQTRDHYHARCQAIRKAAEEFFFAYESCRCLIFQKVRDTTLLPEFTEYVACWFADDRLCGTILSGVTSDAGSHTQVDELEAEAEAHAAEIAEALGRKYPEKPYTFVNHFDFKVCSAPPDTTGHAAGDLFTAFERLTSTVDGGEAGTRIETAYCGPGIASFGGRSNAAEIPTGTTHSSQAFRKGFASDDCLVIYDFKLERYVRTIESMHVYENLLYLSRSLAADLGRRLNAQQCAGVRDQAGAQIQEWRNALDRAETARRSRIDRLTEIL